MCGIAGLFALDGSPVDASPLAGMLDRIVHRGPDDRGVHIDGPLAMGMTRLSIVDVDGGHQPMSDADGSIWVVFNGELYGFAELRSELESLGHRFRTRSDTEVLIHGYRAWGIEVVERVRGMFALAIWDAPRRRLLLARDRIGEKPLYLAELGAAVAFASELKCLTALRGFDDTVDLGALDEYLAYGFVSSPLSFRRGARKLMPGHRAVLEGGRMRIEPYWRPPTRASEPFHDHRDACDAVDHAVLASVREQMVADVPLGAFLSGGIDSSLVVSAMVRAGHGRVKTFCAGFDDAGADERPAARRIAEHLGTEHHELLVEPHLARDLPRLVAHFDEPFGDKSLLPTYLVAKEARRHVKVVLTGDGGDELFGGYRSHLVSMQRAASHARRGRLVNRIIAGAAGMFPASIPGSFRVRKRALDPVGRFAAGSMLFAADERLALLTPATRAAMPTVDALARRLAADVPTLDVLGRMLRLDLLFYLPEDVLVKVDRMTMLCSLESRAPLLDPRVVELAFRVPSEQKIAGSTGKRVLRDVLARHLPPSLQTPGKQGFTLPIAAWLRADLRDLVADTLRGRALRDTGWFRPEALDALVEEIRRPDAAPADRVFRLLCLGLHLESQRGSR